MVYLSKRLDGQHALAAFKGCKVCILWLKAGVRMQGCKVDMFIALFGEKCGG